MSARYLLPLSSEAFDAIPQRVVPRTVRIQDPTLEGPRAIAWIANGDCEKLIYKNEKLKNLLETFAQRLDEPECRNCFTHGQWLLLTLNALDGQVNNGGITQFFWNCPDLILEVPDALKAIGEVELLELYDKALGQLITQQHNWIDLRKQWCKDSDNPKWETFEASYELLNLGWFDTAYFNRNGPLLLKRLANYVKDHREEFIES